MKIEDIKSFNDYALFIKEFGYYGLTKDDVQKLTDRLKKLGEMYKGIINRSSLSKGYKRIEMRKIDKAVSSFICILRLKTERQNEKKRSSK